MRFDGIYNPDDDTIEITYQENPTRSVQTIKIARGHEHHLRNILYDLELEDFSTCGWEIHIKDADRPYDP